MFKIIAKEKLAKDITRLVIDAPQIAKKAQAGQFVVVISDEKGERIPLTLADWNKDKGTISLIFQEVGYTTRKLGAMEIWDSIEHVLGPLGHPTAIKNISEVFCIAGGVGIAEVYPVARAFKEAGCRVIGIVGTRSKDLLFLENEMRKICDEFFVTTDDGSYARKGFVTHVLKELLDVVEKSTHTKYPDLVYCIGPLPMMQAVAQLTKDYQIKTIVSLNPIMVDATGMCGSCRCTVDGKSMFGCVDGPDFDGHKIDFEELQKRLNLFKNQEASLKD